MLPQLLLSSQRTPTYSYNYQNPNITADDNHGHGSQTNHNHHHPYSIHGQQRNRISSNRSNMQQQQQQSQQQQRNIPTTMSTPRHFVMDLNMRIKLEPGVKRPNNGDFSDPPRKRAKQELLVVKLKPVLDELRRRPESQAFLQPVDPQALNLQNYQNVIKHPMDLATMSDKLHTNQYKDEWEFMGDFKLMISNAHLFNKGTSPVFKSATKLDQFFDLMMKPIMRIYCCAEMKSFRCQIVCNGKESCIIHYGDKYHTYEDEQNTRYEYCVKCFKGFKKGPVVFESEDERIEIEKRKFQSQINDRLDPEKFVTCKMCRLRYHQICVLHHEEIWKNGFTCDTCLNKNGQTREENPFTAQNLKQNVLGGHIEEQVNEFLQSKSPESNGIIIRVLSSVDKVFEVKPHMKRRYVDSGQSQFSPSFPYRSKAIYAFQEIDGVDVCFFGMIVQEYGADCPPPNTGSIYLAYLDSVDYFSPRERKTEIYNQIILNYLDAVRLRGFKMVYIWACPPKPGDDYIFHCHPPSQRIPTPKRLKEWYKALIEQGARMGIVDYYEESIRNYADALDDPVKELPYFDGDWWPISMEEVIPATELEEAKSLQQENLAHKNPKKAKSPKKGKGVCKKNSGKIQTIFEKKMFAQIDNVRDDVLMAQFKPPTKNLTNEIISDPDPTIHCDLMDGRDKFLTFARDNHNEFSTLRKAKFATMSLLKVLHDELPSATPVCDECEKKLKARYHCLTCPNLDLCSICYAIHPHSYHQMEKLDFEEVEDSVIARRKAFMQLNDEYVFRIDHASSCTFEKCSFICRRFKAMLEHYKICDDHRRCVCCSQIKTALQYHTFNCEDVNCRLSLCSTISSLIRVTANGMERAIGPSRAVGNRNSFP